MMLEYSKIMKERKGMNESRYLEETNADEAAKSTNYL